MHEKVRDKIRDKVRDKVTDKVRDKVREKISIPERRLSFPKSPTEVTVTFGFQFFVTHICAL